MSQTTTQPKPFGYVLRYKGASAKHYPWCDPRRWSDAHGKCGNMRRHIGDAQVFKRLSSAQQYPELEIVPVYSDPRQTGERALIP